MSAARRGAAPLAGDARLARAAHDLRSCLSGMRGWVAVLENRLGALPDDVVRRALDGIHTAIAQQLDVIEGRLEGGREADQ